MNEQRKVWVKIRASEAERSEWHAKARAVGLSLSDLVRRSVGRVRTWTEASAKDLKQQVEILAANYKEIAEVLRGV